MRAMRKVHSDDIQTAFARLAISVRGGEEGNDGLTFAKLVDLLD